jgi:hypothetical protein
MSQFRFGTERITQHESQMRFQRQPAWEKIATAASSPSNGNCQPQLNTVSTYQSATLVLLRKRALVARTLHPCGSPAPRPRLIGTVGTGRCRSAVRVRALAFAFVQTAASARYSVRSGVAV